MSPTANTNLESKIIRTSPFLKWAGGKGRLLAQLDPLFPKANSYKRYFEPFLGGGAVFFHLASKNTTLESYLSDANFELINCYQVVKNQPTELLSLLANMRNDKHFFYKVRAQDITQMSELERAARLIYLNKTCFNGLYRVNRKGQFNVPFGKYKNPRIADYDGVARASALLERASLISGPFDAVTVKAKKGDFVYFDPPYQPLSKTANFTSYTLTSFGMADQERLAALVGRLTKEGVKVMVSNSDTPELRTLYENIPGVSITTVQAARAINCHGDKRGAVSELVIRNY
ncbi:MAG: modification methylase [Cyanobacteria bacterium PR.023]|nr:modification methylase [Cyanobacteria bacterium PR.023]